MYEVIYIRHDQITPNLIDEIIKVKTAAWPYSYESQLVWIQSNIKNSDLHVLLMMNNKLVAYLNLTSIEFKINFIPVVGFGVGNVCALEKGKGWGKELISRVNLYLLENNVIGLLFCKEELMRFYNSTGWTEIGENKVILPECNTKVRTLIYNFPDNFELFEYSGYLF